MEAVVQGIDRIEAALRVSLTSDYDLRHAKFRELREVFPLQLRGQDTTTPLEEDREEFASLLWMEAFAVKQRREVSAIHVQERN
jgi:hypothetical protein